MRLHILPCGHVVVDEALPVKSRSVNPIAWTGLFRGAKHKIKVPVTAYLIEHEKGSVLVDSGWPHQVRTDARGYLGFATDFASKAQLPEGQLITEQLARLGYSPADLDACIITHMDADHIGGLQELRGAKRILAAEKELAAAQKVHPRYLKKLWQGFEIEPITQDYFDLFGDGSVLLKQLPGHSAGTTGMILNGLEQFALIIGDCGYCRESWEQLHLPGIMADRSAALSSLQWVQEQSQRSNCVGIFATHDPEIQPQILIL